MADQVLQQVMRQWVSCWTGIPAAGQVSAFQKQWTQLLQRQGAMLEGHLGQVTAANLRDFQAGHLGRQAGRFRLPVNQVVGRRPKPFPKPRTDVANPDLGIPYGCQGLGRLGSTNPGSYKYGKK